MSELLRMRKRQQWGEQQKILQRHGDAGVPEGARRYGVACRKHCEKPKRYGDAVKDTAKVQRKCCKDTAAAEVRGTRLRHSENAKRQCGTCRPIGEISPLYLLGSAGVL